MAVAVLSMRSRACFWAGFKGMWGFSSEEEPSLADGSKSAVSGLSVIFDRRRVFSRPFGKMAAATEGRGLR